jgi:cation diffusion facilitator family transporter
MFGAAKAHRSIALEADAKHLVTDVWTSVGVVIGIGLVSLTGWLWLDAVVAIAVALNILKEGVHLIWRSSQGLMDEAVEPETIAKINEKFQHHRNTDTINYILNPTFFSINKNRDFIFESSMTNTIYTLNNLI